MWNFNFKPQFTQSQGSQLYNPGAMPIMGPASDEGELTDRHLHSQSTQYNHGYVLSAIPTQRYDSSNQQPASTYHTWKQQNKKSMYNTSAKSMQQNQLHNATEFQQPSMVEPQGVDHGFQSVAGIKLHQQAKQSGNISFATHAPISNYPTRNIHTALKIPPYPTLPSRHGRHVAPYQEFGRHQTSSEKNTLSICNRFNISWNDNNRKMKSEHPFPSADCPIQHNRSALQMKRTSVSNPKTVSTNSVASSLRVVTCTPEGLYHWAERLLHFKFPIIYELFGSVLSIDYLEDKVQIVIKGRATRLESIYYCMDQDYPMINTGEDIRAIGRLDTNAAVFQCISVRVATADEKKHVNKLIANCEKDLNQLLINKNIEL